MTSHPVPSAGEAARRPRAGGRRAYLALFSLGMIVALLLTACGGSSSSSNKGPHKLVMNPSPSGSFTENFNPLIGNGNGTNLFGTQGFLYETLMYYNRLDGSQSPLLATSYDVSSDGLSVTIHLRTGVKWSDGQPFSSDDVVYTYNLLKQNPKLDLNNLWGTLKAVSAPDANTVVATLQFKSMPFLWYLLGQTFIVPKHAWSTQSGDLSQFTNTSPVGTGPFKLGSFSSQVYKFVRNPLYWQADKVKVDEIDFPAFSGNDSAELALSRGQVDWAGQFVDHVQNTYVSRDSEHFHYWFPPHQVTMLYLNLAKAPFNDLRVRQAISDAIDRNQLSQVAEQGYQGVASPTGLILPNNQAWLDPQYANATFTPNQSQAASLLQQAGFTKGPDGILVDKNGKKFSFSLQVPTGWTDWISIIQLIQNQLKPLGIDVQVKTPSQAAYTSAMQQGTYDAVVSWTNPGPTPYYLYNALLNSANSAPVGKQAASNYERWNDAQTDNLLKQFAQTADQATQKQAIAGLEKIMVEQLPAIPLLYGTSWYEYSTRNFTGWPSQQQPYAVPSPYEAPDNEIVITHLQPAA